MNVGSDTINIKASDWFKKNPSCMPSSKPMLGSKPCAVFIGVFCISTECSYSIKAFADTDSFHVLLNG